jgi:hypothetical protein
MIPGWRIPVLASGISAGPPGTGKRGPADGAVRHPYQNASGLPKRGLLFYFELRLGNAGEWA